MLASSFFHELGHASACKYFGVRHGGVGFGLYLTFPVLYTDVTEIWKLNRRQRCVVNWAGVYFQSYGLILLLVAFFVTGDDILRYLILIMKVIGSPPICWACLTCGNVPSSCWLTSIGESGNGRLLKSLICCAYVRWSDMGCCSMPSWSMSLWAFTFSMSFPSSCIGLSGPSPRRLTS